ncbi:hypothetical protein [Ruegeria sp. HKCCA0370]|uniref:hypothetical protein n=1 Tax=Ruegeria sp. HKCCA0370 TaxID=2682995 RepID=UPI001489C963|nr:hypothetical protein [Ruegeria sp. HKCCA0370]
MPVVNARRPFTLPSLKATPIPRVILVSEFIKKEYQGIYFYIGFFEFSRIFPKSLLRSHRACPAGMLTNVSLNRFGITQVNSVFNHPAKSAMGSAESFGALGVNDCFADKADVRWVRL